jgi:hypothetical protein
MRAALSARFALIDQAQISLVNERRRLQSVIFAVFAVQIIVR